MKFLHTIIFSTFALAVSAQSQPKYAINGHLPGYDNNFIYLRKGPVVIDSTKVVNGHFTFKGVVPEPTAANLFDKKGQVNSFILENTSYTLTGKNAKIEEATLQGGGPNELDRQALEKSKGPLYKQMENLVAKYRENESNGDSLLLKSIIGEHEVVSKQAGKLDLDYIGSHPKSFLSFFKIWDLSQQDEVETAYKLYQQLDPSVRNSAVGLRGKKAFDAQLSTVFGKIAADFTQNDRNGQPLKLSSLRGKYVLLDFWASWCGPCRAENPNLIKDFERFKDKGFTVLGVSLDQDKAAWEKAIVADKLDWHHVSDLKGWSNEVAILYGIRAVPSSFLIDPQGRIIATNLRGDNLTQKLTEIFNK